MSEPSDSDVVVERPADGVALVTIDAARRFNTLRVATLQMLEVSVRALAVEPDVRAIVVTGAGGAAFAAGADLREVAALDARDALAFAAIGQSAFDAIERAPQPVLAAIDGVCMGGGLDLALACDLRHASPASAFAHPGAVRGILTGFGGTARLPRVVGRARAMELFATGRRLTADEALAIGLVNRVVDDPVASALEVARAIASRSFDEVQTLKRLVVEAFRAASR